MADWKLPNDAKAQIARYVSAHGVEESALHRRKQLEGELARLADLYRWDHIDRGAYLKERSELENKLAALPAVPTAPPDDAFALIDKIGEVWSAHDDAWRRRFVDEWFEEVRLGRDRSSRYWFAGLIASLFRRVRTGSRE